MDFLLNKTSKKIAKELLQWYRKSKRDLPWRSEVSPYRTAVSELMCQQTQIATVLPYYDRWMKKFPSWQSLAKAKEQEVLKLWEGLGYYRRARMLHAMAKAVVDLPEQALPSDVEQLQKLPGIGRYTAGAIASIAFGKRAAVVDGNVERVFARVFNLKWNVSEPATRKKLFELAESLLPEAKDCGDFNQGLMELGATICTPRKPQCLICPIQKHCRSEEPELLPIKTKQKTIEESETLAFILEKKKVWLELPENPKRWKGVWRLPHLDLEIMTKSEPLLSHAYSVTKYRIEAKVVKSNWKKDKKEKRFRSFSAADLEKEFLPAPHRKMIENLFSSS
jgi:A/G-specific adenine glycosylase